MQFRVYLIGIAMALPQLAPAQVYLNPPVLAGEPVTGSESGLSLPLPSATPEEYSAALVWNMRSGLNVAALQCSYSAFLDTTDNYNALLSNHREDLASAYKRLTGYFLRIAGPKNLKAATQAFDDYNTKSYNGWSTLYAQRGFCNEASTLGKELQFVPKGGMLVYAQQHMREFRNSLVFASDPIWATPALYVAPPFIPDFAPSCYNKKGEVKAKCMR